MCLQYILIRTITSILLPHPLPPILRTISMFYFHTCLQSTSIIFALFHPLWLLSSPHRYPLPNRPALPSCLSFFKYILIVWGGVALVFHTCIDHILIRLAHSITYSFSVTLLPYYSIAYHALRYTIFTHDFIFNWQIIIVYIYRTQCYTHTYTHIWNDCHTNYNLFITSHLYFSCV
jgi:hypothetical protein